MRFGSRPVVFIGGIIIFIGYITSMLATELKHLFVTYGLIIGICRTLVFISSSVNLAGRGT